MDIDTQRAQDVTGNAWRRNSLMTHLDRLGLSPDGVAYMIDGVNAAEIRDMLAGRRRVPADLLLALADCEELS